MIDGMDGFNLFILSRFPGGADVAYSLTDSSKTDLCEPIIATKDTELAVIFSTLLRRAGLPIIMMESIVRVILVVDSTDSGQLFITVQRVNRRDGRTREQMDLVHTLTYGNGVVLGRFAVDPSKRGWTAEIETLALRDAGLPVDLVGKINWLFYPWHHEVRAPHSKGGQCELS